MNFRTVLVGLALVMLVTFTAGAQGIAAPARDSAITNSTPFMIGTVGAASTTNLVNPGIARAVGVPRGNGFSVFTTLGATNAGTTANVTFVFELSQDGTYYTTGTNVCKFVVPLNGTSRVSAYTNYTADAFNNIRYVRLREIFNDNTNTTWISNIYIGTFKQ